MVSGIARFRVKARAGTRRFLAAAKGPAKRAARYARNATIGATIVGLGAVSTGTVQMKRADALSTKVQQAAQQQGIKQAVVDARRRELFGKRNVGIIKPGLRGAATVGKGILLGPSVERQLLSEIKSGQMKNYRPNLRNVYPALPRKR